MVSRKRGRAHSEVEQRAAEPSTLERLRNMWQFAALMQYIFMFGKAVKIDEDFDIDELETECLKPYHSEKLSEIGLALLKYVSSHKGLTPDLFDEYARRQYVAKAPHRNPFGVDEEPKKFAEFDVFTKVTVLHQLSTWTLYNPDRLREKMGGKDTEQTEWRMEPVGWDAEDCAYFVLDDDRLYRRTDAPPPPPPPKKAKAKAKSRRTRSSKVHKKRKISIVDTEDEDEETAPNGEAEGGPADAVDGDDGFGGMKWECIAVTLEDYNSFIASIQRTRDANTKILLENLTLNYLPYMEHKAEEQERKRLKKEKELETLQKLALAKRSSRIADKMLKQKEQEEAAEVERKRQAELAMARKEQDKQRKMEEERQSRMMTREQRQREREAKRILQEEELRRLEEASQKVESNESRLSERHLQSEMRKRQDELQKLQQDEDWVFDCSVCGVHGENLDDGSHSIACDKCNVWQHSACHGIPKDEAEKDDFHFICDDCKRREEEKNKPKLPPLKFKLGSSASPQSERTAPPPSGSAKLEGVEAPVFSQTPPRPPSLASIILNPSTNGPGPPQQGQETKPSQSHATPPRAGPEIRTGGFKFPPAYYNGDRPSNIQPSAPSVSPSRDQIVLPPPNALMPGSPQKQPSSTLLSYNYPHSSASFSQHRAPFAPENPTANFRGVGLPSLPHPYGARPAVPIMNGGPQAGQGYRQAEFSKTPPNYQFQRPVSSSPPLRHHLLPNVFDRQNTSVTGGAPQQMPPIRKPLSGSSTQTNGQLPQLNPTITSPSASFPPGGSIKSATSPVKLSSPLQQPSPRPLSTFNSPAASFPPSRPAQGVDSPFSHTSSPPNPHILAGTVPGISPEKHDGPRPASSHSVSETPIFPPSTALSPSAKPQIFTPPTKKATPEQPALEVNGSGSGTASTQ